MAIRIEQPGASKSAAQAGTAIGRAERAKEDRARAEREQARAQQIAAQQQARQAALEWEQQKMRMRSEQEFQQELAAKQWDYERFNRAKAWEIDKMEIASRLDFERDEKIRTEKADRFNIGVKSIEKARDDGTITEDRADRALFDLASKNTEVEDAAQYLGRPESLMGGRESALSLLGGETGTPTPEPVKGIKTFTDPKTKEPIYVPENEPFVSVMHPTKGVQRIRVEQLQEAMDDYGVTYIPKQKVSITKRTKGGWGTGAEQGSFGNFLGLNRR